MRNSYYRYIIIIYLRYCECAVFNEIPILNSFKSGTNKVYSSLSEYGLINSLSIISTILELYNQSTHQAKWQRPQSPC